MSQQQRCARLAKEPVISNFKVSFRTDTPLRLAVRALTVTDCRGCYEEIFDANNNAVSRACGSCVRSVRLLHNFAVVKTCRHVYTLNDSGFVNITKLRVRSDVDEAVEALCWLKLLPHPSEQYVPKVDNVTASGAFGYTVPLHLLSLHVRFSGIDVAKLTYRPNYFSGATLKYHGSGATIIVFATGSFTIVGAKSEEQVWSVYRQTQRLLLPLLS